MRVIRPNVKISSFVLQGSKKSCFSDLVQIPVRRDWDERENTRNEEKSSFRPPAKKKPEEKKIKTGGKNDFVRKRE